MSDALTDIRRDEKRRELQEKMLPLELKVLAGEATKADIEELLELWKKWVELPRGYWTASSRSRYNQRKALYEELLEQGQVSIKLI